MRYRVFPFFFLLLWSISISGIYAEKRFAATDEGLSYTGRVLRLADGTVRFDWTGVYVQTDFTGTGISVEVSDTKRSFLNVFIDGKFIRKVCTESATPVRLTLVSDLEQGTHRLLLQKATEGREGCITLSAFYVSGGEELRSVPAKQRMIEFIGDSYTCGYGVESASRNERFKADTENSYRAFAAIVARYFNADYALIAHSGKGISRNYGDTQPVSEGNMLERYMKLFDEASDQFYDFKAYRPDLVVINIGSNDFSKGTVPTPEQFADNYVKLIETVRERYGMVPVACIVPHSANASLVRALDEVMGRTRNFRQLVLTDKMSQIIDNDKDLGANWHPNCQGQRKVAMMLIPQISNLMGWLLESKVVE